MDASWVRAAAGLADLSADGRLSRVNATLAAWLRTGPADLEGTLLRDHLTIGSQLFYETRMLPPLELAGSVREVALTFARVDGTELPVLVNASRDGADGIRLAVFDASERSDFERQLVDARRSAENSERRVSALLASSRAFLDATTPEELGAALVAAVQSASGAREVALFERRSNATFEMTGGRRTLPLPVLDSELIALGTGDAWTVTSLDEASEYGEHLTEAMRTARLEAMSALPIAGGDHHAVVVAYFARQRPVDEIELELQRSLGLQWLAARQRIVLEQRLARLALHDPLTGLANRTQLRIKLDETLASTDSVAVVFLDLDGFKAVNDELGHAAGDEVLVAVARRLTESVRVSDTVSRYGGDEFAIVLHDADPAEAASVAQRVLDAIHEPYPHLPGDGLRIAASVGLALSGPATAASPVGAEQLLLQADDAMYHSKNAGGNTVTVHRARDLS